jgi:hypothetical protein
MPRKGPEHRKTRRVPVKLSVRVQARDQNGTRWEEMATTEDVSAGGLALVLQQSVPVGQVLHLTLALPSQFREYDLTQASYRVYGLVRVRRGDNRYGVQFLGRHPPRGAEPLPSELFLLPGDPKPLAPGKHGFEVLLRLEAEHAPGGIVQEERSIAENVRARGVDARVTTLPVLKGALVTLEEMEGDYKTRAEVQGIEIAKDGHPRLKLLLLDEPVPERLLPPVGHDEVPS